ncbi:hypothetical protein [Bacillus sp. B1-b2]|uniref:hypothetical protein n=1 Tax=Bacillus sp. B1-b2 TaxID=2653201 RepID=UPI00186A3203|nr:hypothetical protein [Bacillus sp. B1-b2]
MNQQKKFSPVKVRLIPLDGTQNRSQILKKIEISSSFNMKYKALFEYYGDDLIEYKKLDLDNKQRNDFLRIFSSYLTDFLEDTMPTSWKKCSTSFLKQLCYLYLPSTVQISQNKNHITLFLEEFRHFATWLDKKENTKWMEFIDKHLTTLQTLQTCEDLHHTLFLQLYPTYLHSTRNDQKHMEKVKQLLNQCQEVEDGLFQIRAINTQTVSISNIFTNRIYDIHSTEIQEKHLGIILDVSIGIYKNHSTWTILVPLGIYPKEAKSCFTNL